MVHETIPTTVEAMRMLMKLSLLKKYGDSSEKKTIRASSTNVSAVDSGTRATPRLARFRHLALPAGAGVGVGSVGSGATTFNPSLMLIPPSL